MHHDTVLDPPEPEHDAPPPEAITVESDGSISVEPAALIPIDRVLKSCEGVTVQDVAEAIVLEQQALSIKEIDDELVEERVGDLLDAMRTVDERIEAKGRGWCELAFKLHRGLTGLFGEKGNARQHTQAGLRHLRPLLAKRLEAKRQAELARQQAEREEALRQERERKLQEAAHAETVGASPAEVESILQEAETLPPPPVAAQPITAIRGVSTRENWKAEIVSKQALIVFVAAHPEFLNLLDVNTTAANQMAKAQKANLKIPGLRAFNDVVLNKRR